MNTSPPPHGGKSYVIVGMPGSGKSSVGRLLAKAYGLPFQDSDHVIEAKAGLSIPDIFRLQGEPAFRKLEQETIIQLLGETPMVLATGGGAYMNEHTRAAIRQHGIAIWLKTELQELHSRTAHKTNRPLLEQDDKLVALEKLLQQREAIYATADVSVVSDHRPVKNTVERLLQILHDHAQSVR